MLKSCGWWGLLLLVCLSHAGQQLDGVLGPHPHRPVQFLLQHVVVVTLGGAHHLPHIGDKLLSLDKLNPSIHLKCSLYLEKYNRMLVTIQFSHIEISTRIKIHL